MIPPRILEKAIEGGWKHPRGLSDGRYARFHWEHIALDPAFWQALGKSCGWKDGGGKNHDLPWIVHYNVDVQKITAKWLNWQMEFNYLILTDGDTDAFWAELIPDGK